MNGVPKRVPGVRQWFCAEKSFTMLLRILIAAVVLEAAIVCSLKPGRREPQYEDTKELLDIVKLIPYVQSVRSVYPALENLLQNIGLTKEKYDRLISDIRYYPHDVFGRQNDQTDYVLQIVAGSFGKLKEFVLRNKEQIYSHMAGYLKSKFRPHFQRGESWKVARAEQLVNYVDHTMEYIFITGPKLFMMANVAAYDGLLLDFLSSIGLDQGKYDKLQALLADDPSILFDKTGRTLLEHHLHLGQGSLDKLRAFLLSDTAIEPFYLRIVDNVAYNREFGRQVLLMQTVRNSLEDGLRLQDVLENENITRGEMEDYLLYISADPNRYAEGDLLASHGGFNPKTLSKLYHVALHLKYPAEYFNIQTASPGPVTLQNQY